MIHQTSLIPCSQADVYGTRLSCLARSCIFEYITLGGRRCEALASVLSSSSYEENFNAFIEIISYLLSLRYVATD